MEDSAEGTSDPPACRVQQIRTAVDSIQTELTTVTEHAASLEELLHKEASEASAAAEACSNKHSTMKVAFSHKISPATHTFNI